MTPGERDFPRGLSPDTSLLKRNQFIIILIPQVDPENLTVNAVLIAMASVVGLALLLNCRTWWQVADSVLNSQRKRLHSAANNLHKLKSEGFMKVK